ncbi:MAG: ATP synthase subunit I [Nitrospirota bacterium]|jgi:F1F0 ATPase subunit 2
MSADYVLVLLLCALGGAALGAANYAGLWVTTKRIAQTARPFAVSLASLLLRMSLVLGGFYLIMDQRWERLLGALAGFLIVRTSIMHRVRPAPPGAGKKPRGAGGGNGNHL